MVRASCELFVPKIEVKGSSTCAICEREESDHSCTSPFSSKDTRSSSSSDSPVITPSENSAFSIYRKNGEDPRSRPRPVPPGEDPILRRRPVPIHPRPSRSLIAEKHSDSNIRRRIADQQRPRSSSVGKRLDEDESCSSSSPSPSLPERKESRRARNFQQILTRFQFPLEGMHRGDPHPLILPLFESASEAAPRPQRRTTVGTLRLNDSPALTEGSISRRSSLHENSPSRTNSSRSHRHSAVPSPISHYLPEAVLNKSHFSSHRNPPKQETTKEETRDVFDPPTLTKPIPLTISIPQQRRRNPLPLNWVKETDIDDPNSFCTEFSLMSSPEETDRTPFVNPIPVTLIRESYEKGPNAGGSRRVREYQNNGGSTGTLFKRSRSREDHLNDTVNDVVWRADAGTIASRSSTAVSPSLTLSRAKAVENNYSQMAKSTDLSLSFSVEWLPITGRDNGAPEKNEDKLIICSSHVNTLSWALDRLTENAKKAVLPVGCQPQDIQFQDLLIHRGPVLIKGTSYFFDATLVKERQQHEVTVMICPHSHYAPVLRRGLGVTTMAEIEDDQEETIAKFISSYSDDDLPCVKAVVMPRFKLCSLHSLAAQHMHRMMSTEDFEAHVSFIMIRLLSALKLLQTDGIESLSTNFREFLLVYLPSSFRGNNNERTHDIPQLLFLPDSLESPTEEIGEMEQVGLCRYAMRALCTLIHHRMDGGMPRIRDQSRHSKSLLAVARSLHSDKSSSLSTSKQLLELSLFSQGSTVEADFEAKMWLDVKRAECINQLLRHLIENGEMSDEKERLRMEFLLSSTPRSLSHSHITLSNTHFN